MSAYRPYPKTKPSGVEWLGDVPEGWEVTKLKYSSVMEMGQSPNSEDYNVESKGYPFLQGNAEFGERVPNAKHWCETAKKLAKRGDFLFSVRAPIGAVNEADQIYGIGRGLCAIRPLKQIVERRFVFYSFFPVRDQMSAVSTGSTFEGVSAEQLGSSRHCLPPLPEQHQIATFLDRECGKLDALQAKQERLIELLKEKRQALISHAVTKGLNPNAKLKNSGIEWLGDVPEHWRICRVKHVAKLESGHTPSKTVPEYWEDCNIPWVSLNDTKQLKNVDYITETTLQISELGMRNSSAHLLPERAVIFTRDATIGLAAITTRPMAVSQHIIAWICKERFVIPEFLLLVFYGMASDLERFTAGATLKTIGMPDVNKLSAAIPPVIEQRAIVERIYRKMRNIDAATAKAERGIELLKERRSALISAAVTGKIDVRAK